MKHAILRMEECTSTPYSIFCEDSFQSGITRPFDQIKARWFHLGFHCQWAPLSSRSTQASYQWFIKVICKHYLNEIKLINQSEYSVNAVAKRCSSKKMHHCCFNCQMFCSAASGYLDHFFPCYVLVGEKGLLNNLHILVLFHFFLGLKIGSLWLLANNKEQLPS